MPLSGLVGLSTRLGSTPALVDLGLRPRQRWPALLAASLAGNLAANLVVGWKPMTAMATAGMIHAGEGRNAINAGPRGRAAHHHAPPTIAAPSTSRWVGLLSSSCEKTVPASIR